MVSLKKHFIFIYYFVYLHNKNKKIWLIHLQLMGFVQIVSLILTMSTLVWRLSVV